MTGRLLRIGFMIILLLIISAAQISVADISQNSYGITSPKTEYKVSESSIASSSEPHAFMRPSSSQIKEWNDQYRSEKSAVVTSSASVKTTGGETAMSLLEFLNYNPAERNQQMCGNCWVWTSTGAIEIAHAVQNNVFDRISIQYVNSKYNNGGNSPFNPANFACQSGHDVEAAKA